MMEALADRLKGKGIKFVIEPHVRFVGLAGEQLTMFFKDPAGNNLEFKVRSQSQRGAAAGLQRCLLQRLVVTIFVPLLLTTCSRVRCHDLPLPAR